MATYRPRIDTRILSPALFFILVEWLFLRADMMLWIGMLYAASFAMSLSRVAQEMLSAKISVTSVIGKGDMKPG